MSSRQGIKKYTKLVLGRPLMGRLRQGVIFSGALAEGYEDCVVHGVIITAHCDLVHGKAPVVNYLPVVRLDDWLLRDYSRILRNYLVSETTQKINHYLNYLDISETVLFGTSLDRVIECMVRPRSAQNKKYRKQLPKLEEGLQQQEFLSGLAQKEALSESELNRLTDLNNRASKHLLTNCVRQSHSDFHFLPAVHPDEHSNIGYVVLLRMIYHLPSYLGRAVGRGLAAEEFEAMVKKDPDFAGRLSTDETDFAMPVGQLLSPHLEQLMQRFATLYTRIGVEDIPLDVIDSIANRIGSEDE